MGEVDMGGEGLGRWVGRGVVREMGGEGCRGIGGRGRGVGCRRVSVCV